MIPSPAILLAQARAFFPTCPPEHPDVRMLGVFLAAQYLPCVDRLAACFSCSREEVSRWARRWMDHGLWDVGIRAETLLDRRDVEHVLRLAKCAVRPWNVLDWEDEEE